MYSPQSQFPANLQFAPLTLRALLRMSVATLIVLVIVIAWGALVRATGSGAGCGSHWPACNGQIVPIAYSLSTWIEWIHRATSGFSLLMVLGQWIWVRRVTPRGASVRVAATLSLVLILVEAAIGAGLVLFELVGNNSSILRAVIIAIHLANTFLLLGAQTAVVHYLHNAPFGWKFRQRVPRSGAALLTALIVVGMSGAIVALGDTLFPAASLLEGMKADFAAGQHFLIRLRILHPLLAMAVAAALIYAAWLGQTAGLGRRLVIPLVVGQILLGTANFLLLAPITLQILHLLLADFLWIAVMFWQLERSMSPILTPHFILRSNLPATSGG